MKYLVKFIVVTFFVLICTYSQAEQKTVYLDMKYILNNCKAGKAAQDYLAKSFKDNQKQFQSTEKKLKEQETDLLAKKDDLSKEDYKKEADSLRVVTPSREHPYKMWTKKGKNIQLSLGLNKIILIIGVIKLLYLTRSMKRDMSICDLSRELYC